MVKYVLDLNLTRLKSVVKVTDYSLILTYVPG